ncbi:anthranilate synthase component I family protein [Mucisphaera calidilacus]|uniref:Aminodeoxychorismate synthase component 1 n=1 Tax=Mucisphaera calidilacus TaxID=2527982 RepID=A0A518BY66_9BACT|nr:anthranilate synthase component I family protein [Mucisphaera calidilacus]QDU71927.1 Aminodeoxychorismate synthase component 1 [Mucisphaera calidilacus]
MINRQKPITLLHSARHHPRWARHSILGTPRAAWRVWIDTPATFRAEHLDHRGNILDTQTISDPFEPLRWARKTGSLWAGYVGYEAGRALEATLDPERDNLRWPLLQIQQLEDHQTLQAGPLPSMALNPDAPWHADTPKPSRTREQYLDDVRYIIDAIHQGDLFQANLTHQLKTPFTGCPRAFYADLATQSPAWYGSLIELLAPPEEPQRTLASISPELFLEVDHNRMTTRPIKGTATTSDQHELIHSAKDAAELNMIVDVLRNDLGRSAAIGTVSVDQSRHIETHPTVAHGVATVTAQLRPGDTWIDALRLASPGGSITGAPKVQAMKRIDQREPEFRGPYCGSIGFFRNDTCCWNIAIRTAVITQSSQNQQGELRFGVGGGIVADSVPEEEWIETQVKARSILTTIGQNRSLATAISR